MEMSEWFQRDLIMCFWKQLEIIPFPSGFYFLFPKKGALPPPSVHQVAISNHQEGTIKC